MQDLRKAVLLPLLLASAGVARDGAAESGCTPPRDGQATRSGDTATDSWIGPYRVVETLGSGGMGTVYLAEQAAPVRRRIAVKVAGDSTPEHIRQFDIERQALAETNHANVVRLYDGGTTADGRPYYAMEPVRGIPITAYCDEAGLDVAARTTLFRQVCAAVQHLHDRGILHRDLKPSNVLVTEESGSAVVKIIDLGLAHRTTGHPEATLAAVVGTPGYMSPEQAHAATAQFDERTDVYALGVLLYELVTGVPPFSPAQLCRHGVDSLQSTLADSTPPTPIARLRALGPGADSVARLRQTRLPKLERMLRGRLTRTVMRALSRAPEDRPASAAKFADDLGGEQRAPRLGVAQAWLSLAAALTGLALGMLF